jgi:hypothetical protein
MSSYKPKGVTTAAIATNSAVKSVIHLVIRTDDSTPVEAVESVRRRDGHSEECNCVPITDLTVVRHHDLMGRL